MPIPRSPRSQRTSCCSTSSHRRTGRGRARSSPATTWRPGSIRSAWMPTTRLSRRSSSRTGAEKNSCAFIVRTERTEQGNGRQKPRKPQCAQVTLAAATYTMRVAHDGGSIAGAHRAAFAQPMSASPRLIDDAGASLGGYWALRPDPTLDPRRRIGRVIAPPPDRSVPGTPFTAIRPLLADFAARQIDDAGLFRFADPNDPTVGSHATGARSTSPSSTRVASGPASRTTVRHAATPSSGPFHSS